MMFNPIPDSRNLKVDIVKGPATRTVTADASRTTIVCITGPITANDKTLVSLQHAKVFSGKTAELVVPENSVCALVTE
jgi:redox-sensitive bicupin YhaK (pirin superfamily)